MWQYDEGMKTYPRRSRPCCCLYGTRNFHGSRNVHRCGFTLIELLVVIAIIGILAALLFPAFQITRMRANTSHCANNLSQINKYMQMYTADRGSFPGAATDSWLGAHPMKLGGKDVEGRPDIHRPLYDYLPDVEVFSCRADRGSDGGIAGVTDNVYDAWGSSYVYAMEDDSLSGVVGVGGKKITNRMFRYVTRKVVLYEPPLQDDSGGGDLSNRDMWHDRVNRVSNIGFMDGGVRKMAASDLKGVPKDVTQVVEEDRPHYLRAL